MKVLFIFSLFINALVFATWAYPSFAQDSGRGAALRNLMEARIKAMDTNGDGTIDKAEYLAHAEAQFKRVDANGDGRITQDELQKLRDGRRGALDGDGMFP
jgi:hypothetical protein